MENPAPPNNSLVLYKKRPARVKAAGDRLELELDNGKGQKVRPKDVVLLHPGPVQRLPLPAAQPQESPEAVWELLEGESLPLSELAELLFGEYTPATAWAAWQSIEDGLLFSGTPQRLVPQAADAVAEERQKRHKRHEAQAAWDGLVQRVRDGALDPADRPHLAETEQLALGRRDNCRLLAALGRAETPETAHALMLDLSLWSAADNPYPRRLGLPVESPVADLPPPKPTQRLDLTHLEAFAIDDAGSTDADDAVSLEGDTLWVHVADVAARIGPDEAADIEARGRGANLYLPEGTVAMLPPAVTDDLALGLAEESPALSFALRLDDDGGLADCRIHPSRIRVQRFSYAEAETRLDDGPLAGLERLAQRRLDYRRRHGAVEIEYPEVKIRLDDNGRVHILPLPALRSRALVTEAMLAAGEAAAGFALENAIPFPFTRQPPPEEPPTDPQGLAGMLALRRSMKPSQQSTTEGPHAGLGLPVYAQATSPLRRYLDLVVHQQLRAFLEGTQLLDGAQLLERVGQAQAVASHVRQAERLSNRHWTLVFAQQQPDRTYPAVLVDRRQQRGLALLPELGFEAPMHLDRDRDLNSTFEVAVAGINLPRLEIHLRPT